MSIRLGVNIDHVATLRNARGEKHPDPYSAALSALKYGADSITIHSVSYTHLTLPTMDSV